MTKSSLKMVRHCLLGFQYFESGPIPVAQAPMRNRVAVVISPPGLIRFPPVPILLMLPLTGSAAVADVPVGLPVSAAVPHSLLTPSFGLLPGRYRMLE